MFKKALKLVVLLCVVSVVVASLGYSATSKGTSGASTLKLGIGVRPLGMGEAFTGLADDINAIQYNPSGLTNLPKQEIGAMYLKNFLDTYYSSVFYGQAVGQVGYVGGSLTMFDGGDIDINYIDNTGYLYKTEKRKAKQDYVLNLGYAQDFLSENKLSAGANLKILQSELGQESRAVAVGVDLGILYRLLEEKVSIGMSLQNMGPGITYFGGIASGNQADPLPMNIKFGVGYKVMPTVTLVADLGKPNDADMRGNVGVEYTLLNILSLRAGYMSGYDLASLTYGAGIKYTNYQLDYGYGMNRVLDNTHKVSFIVRFGNISPKELAKAEKMYQKGLGFYETKEYARAILWFDKAITINPNHRDSQVKMTESNVKLIEQVYKRGIEFMDKGEFANAMLEFNQVLEMDPSHQEARDKLIESNKKLRGL